jgi:hypothetical protein
MPTTPTPYLTDMIRRCDQCGGIAQCVVVGDTESWDARSATMCAVCLREALAVLEGAKP